MNSYETGWLGEARAAAYLRRRGMRVLSRRFRAAHGEIDLIANSESQPLIWARRTTTQYGKAWIWRGCLLAFISFVPAARKGGTDPDD